VSPAFYRQRRAGLAFLDSFLTAASARELLECARLAPGSAVRGDLAVGFAFYASWADSCGGTVAVRVVPVPTEDVPADVLERLRQVAR
jgi:hypothetical protein